MRGGSLIRLEDASAGVGKLESASSSSGKAPGTRYWVTSRATYAVREENHGMNTSCVDGIEQPIYRHHMYSPKQSVTKFDAGTILTSISALKS